jgi:hypothetical protein
MVVLQPDPAGPAAGSARHSGDGDRLQCRNPRAPHRQHHRDGDRNRQRGPRPHPGRAVRRQAGRQYVLAADPDAIFIAGSSWANHPAAVVTGFDANIAATRASLAPYAKRQGWPELKAIRTGQLFAIEHGLSRALFDYTATYYIAKQVFPDRFTDIDPVGELRRYHERFLPVKFEGTWMARLTPSAT